MKRMHSRLGFMAVGFLCATASLSLAEKATVTLKQDGIVLPQTEVNGTQDGSLKVNRNLAPGVDAIVTYDPKSVAQIEFPENPVVKRAMQLIDQGRAIEALRLINPVVQNRTKMGNVRGNNLAESAVIKAKALAALHREKEAGELLKQLAGNADDPETLRGALVEVMAVWARNGDYQKALETYDKAIAESENVDTLAAAWCHKGDALQALEQYDTALLAYLRVPTLYFDQEALMPQALFGAAHAYLGLGDTPRAIATLKKLINDYPSSKEAHQAGQELPTIPLPKHGNSTASADINSQTQSPIRS